MQHTSYESLEQNDITSSESLETAPIPTPAPITPLEAALEYAKRGWLVLPLWWPTENGCACRSGSDCDRVGKHPIPPDGLTSASKEEGVIRKWFTKWPEANLGIATGSASDLVVVDADDREHIKGTDALNDLFRQHDDAPVTMIVKTGSGYHFYFLHPKVRLKNSVGKIAQGLDIRSDGGYVVAPPSRHRNGQLYALLQDEPVCELPPWLLDLATNSSSALAQEPRPSVPEGKRNDTLFRIACRLRGHEGMERQELLRIMWTFNEVHCNPPLDKCEVIAIVDSACRYPPELKAKKSLSRQNENPLWWMKFNVRDWFSDQNLNAMQDFQVGWYVRLLVFAWNRGGYLTVNPDEQWRLAKAKSRATFEKHKGLVLSRFHEIEDPDGKPIYRHDALARDYAMTLENWLQKVLNGEKATKRTSSDYRTVSQVAD